MVRTRTTINGARPTEGLARIHDHLDNDMVTDAERTALREAMVYLERADRYIRDATRAVDGIIAGRVIRGSR